MVIAERMRRILDTYRLRLRDKAFAIASRFIELRFPRASTSSMCFVMTWVKSALVLNPV